jgi:cell division protein FtsQ
VKTAATVALRAVPRAAVALPPVWRRRLSIALLSALCLSALYLFWFRDSWFAQVKTVEITGLSGPQARSIRAVLRDAGLSMTTLHVRDGDLRSAVATYPVVRSVTATGDFPHKLRIDVVLNLPIAALQTTSGPVPVTSDGVPLPDVPVTPGLPRLSLGGAPPSGRIEAGRAFDLLRVVAAAPPVLRPRIRAVEVKPASGLVAHLRRGPDLIFGTADRMAAKWIAAARVLSSPAAKGATYIDLRLPERPAAGGLPTTSVLPLAPAGAPVVTTPQATTVTATTPAAATGATGATGPVGATGPAAPATTGGGLQAPAQP